ncbi:hypothetical protein [Halomarina pelagica]|uniref:hypothetical protein n=1 Tax=Halomarina pelagica TaxID=2961599 RepID=UPI0020C1C586|nr:hypothetical protein [Halomarina sp. BND7]
MAGRFPNGFDAERQNVDAVSDRALYKYLRVHILGPYINDCHPFLNEVKYRLQEAGFKRAKLCTDRDDTPPAHLQGNTLSSTEEQELREFWTTVSYRFLQNADVAVFFFLDPTINRSNLPSAFQDKNDPQKDHLHGQSTYKTPQDANGSVIEELNYWLREMEMEAARTMVLFEESNYDQTGSLVTGRVGLEACHWGRFEDNEIDSVHQKTRSRCVNWAMDDCKPWLQDQYYAEQF